MISAHEFISMASDVKSECDFYEFVGCKDCLYYMHDARAGRTACIFESITGNPPYEWKVKSSASKEDT